jgi:DNA-binding HxlR family transcriptional regulator
MKQTQARRSACPIAYALDFVGDRWTLIVLRDLIMVRKRHFQEFLASDEKIASNILASRLKLLERAGLATREPDPAHGRRVIYAPTGKALDLLPVMVELMRWTARHDGAAQPQGLRRMMRRIAEDRDAFIAEIRAAHAGQRY